MQGVESLMEGLHVVLFFLLVCPVLPPPMGPEVMKERKKEGRKEKRRRRNSKTRKQRREHTGVHHHVHRALREDGPVARRELLRHQPRAVLLVHVRRRVAVHGNDVVCGARVQVRR